jgi:hypothetical protein
VVNNVGSFLLGWFSKAISKLDSNGTSIDQTSQVIAWKDSVECFIGPCPHRDRDCRIGSKFCKFYFIRASFTLCELVYLVKMFRSFRLKRIFYVQSVNTSGELRGKL